MIFDVKKLTKYIIELVTRPGDVSGSQNLQGDASRRAQEKVPAGRSDSQTVRPPQHRPIHRDLRPEAAHHDCHGAGAGRIPTLFSQVSLCLFYCFSLKNH